MKNILSKLKRKLTGSINTDVKPSIGIPITRTVSNANPILYETKQYTTPFN